MRLAELNHIEVLQERRRSATGPRLHNVDGANRLPGLAPAHCGRALTS
jgi:hypothetical protein